MNRKHLGDAFDHWKGSMFSWLKSSLRDLHVIPMFTDIAPAASWSQAHITFYAGLLHVDRGHILQSQIRFHHKGRKQYFADIRLHSDADLFFDPDVGIKADGRESQEHITPSELSTFLPDYSSRVVTVYQHAFRTNDYVRDTLKRIATSPHLRGVSCLGYRAGAVAMIFISRSDERITSVHDAMHELPRTGDWIATMDSSSGEEPPQ